jgi:glycine dehydrogenase subunit 1
MSYVQNTDEDREMMLKAIGVSSIEELLEPIGKELRPGKPIGLGEPMCESEVSTHLESLAGRNRPASRLSSFLGGGIYDRHIPAVVRYVLSRSEFYTSYTPYQAEVSQGTLQAIYEYQSLICRLTGMEVANASMYDGATALAEAHGPRDQEGGEDPRAEGDLTAYQGGARRIHVRQGNRDRGYPLR